MPKIDPFRDLLYVRAILVLAVVLALVLAWDVEAQSTTECGGGEYLNPVFGICTTCPPGFFAPNETDLVTPQDVDVPQGSALCGGELCDAVFLRIVAPCRPCPIGTAPNSDRTDCEPCPSGTFAPTAGSPVCQQCPAGEFASEEGSFACTACPRGTFASDIGSSQCEQCPENTFNPEPRAAFCLVCPLGKTSVVGSNRCVPCPPGTRAASGGGCVPCDKGSFSAREASLFCKLCPPDTCASRTGSTHCTPCAYGSWAPAGSPICYWSNVYSSPMSW